MWYPNKKRNQVSDYRDELQKLAGLELVADSSGKYNGKTKISKRGGKSFCYFLFGVAILVVGKNEEFKEIHRYNTSKKEFIKKDAVTDSCSM